MIKSISFKDILSLEGFEEFKNEFALLPYEVDEKVFPILWQLGIDTNRGIAIQACKHRTADGDIHLGYRYAGFERSDKQWRDSGYMSVEAVIENANDEGLTEILCEMSKRIDTLNGLRDIDFTGCDDLTGQWIEPDYEVSLSEIEALNSVLMHVRNKDKV